jgi:hypothetical protein
MSTREPRVPTGAVTVLAWLVSVGILVQAFLAGQGWFVSPGLMTLHGGVGHGVLLLAVVTAAAAWLAARRGPALLGTLVVLGLVGQTGLGYAGRRAGVELASSLHVPLGVSLFGASVAVAVWATVGRPTAR